MGILNDMGAVYVTTNTVSCDMTTEEDYDRYHGCQTAIAKSLDRIMCLALRAWSSMGPPRSLQNLIPSFLSIAPTFSPTLAQSKERKGSNFAIWQH